VFHLSDYNHSYSYASAITGGIVGGIIVILVVIVYLVVLLKAKRSVLLITFAPKRKNPERHF